MAKRLAVILGAGASYDSVPPDRPHQKDWIPPLTTQLFRHDNRNFLNILYRYPRADGLSGDISSRLAKGESLEAVLRELRDGEDYVIRQYQQVPLYLKELLGEVSHHFVPNSADNFNSLIRRLLAADFDRVAFITLNYDTLLEQALDTAGDYAFNLRYDSGLD